MQRTTKLLLTFLLPLAVSAQSAYGGPSIVCSDSDIKKWGFVWNYSERHTERSSEFTKGPFHPASSRLCGEPDHDNFLEGASDPARGDWIDGVSGNNTILGYQGDDKLRGGPGNDHIEAHAGDDTIVGEEGQDVMKGGEGNDYISILDEKNLVYGGPGNDTIELRSNHTGGNIWGGTGTDTLITKRMIHSFDSCQVNSDHLTLWFAYDNGSRYVSIYNDVEKINSTHNGKFSRIFSYSELTNICHNWDIRDFWWCKWYCEYYPPQSCSIAYPECLTR